MNHLLDRYKGTVLSAGGMLLEGDDKFDHKAGTPYIEVVFAISHKEVQGEWLEVSRDDAGKLPLKSKKYWMDKTERVDKTGVPWSRFERAKDTLEKVFDYRFDRDISVIEGKTYMLAMEDLNGNEYIKYVNRLDGRGGKLTHGLSDAFKKAMGI